MCAMMSLVYPTKADTKLSGWRRLGRELWDLIHQLPGGHKPLLLSCVVVVVVVVVVTTPHTDANSIQKDNHQLISKRQKGAPLSPPYSVYTKVGTSLLHKRVQRITPVHFCTPGFPPH